MARKMFALLSSQGTACSETALCGMHCDFGYRKKIEEQVAKDKSDDAPILGEWHDCSGNDELHCNVCGYGTAEDSIVLIDRQGEKYFVHGEEAQEEAELAVQSGDYAYYTPAAPSVWRLCRLPTRSTRSTCVRSIRTAARCLGSASWKRLT